eukprot:5956266-Amphidinium_carterae.1
MTTSELESNTEQLVGEVMGLLGWRLTTNPKKIQRFGTVFDMLGVSIDLSKFSGGFVTIVNKRTRVDAMSAAI